MEFVTGGLLKNGDFLTGKRNFLPVKPLRAEKILQNYYRNLQPYFVKFDETVNNA